MLRNETHGVQETLWVPGPGNIVAALLYIVISLVGTAGNSLVLLAVSMSRKVHTTTTAFITALSVSDLMTSLVLPIQSAVLLGATSDVFLKFCAFAGMTSYISIGSNVLLLAEIAFNRFICITKNARTYNRHFTKYRVTVLITISYAIPFGATVLAHVFKGAKSGICPWSKADVNLCTVTGEEFDIFAVTLIAVSVTVTLVFYALIFIHIRRHCQVAVEISCENGGSRSNSCAGNRGSETPITPFSGARSSLPARPHSSLGIGRRDGSNKLSARSQEHLHPSSAIKKQRIRPVHHDPKQLIRKHATHQDKDAPDISGSSHTGSDFGYESVFSNNKIIVSVSVCEDTRGETSVEQIEHSPSCSSSSKDWSHGRNPEIRLACGATTAENPQPRRPRMSTVSVGPVMNPPHRRYRFRYGRNNIESKVTKNMFLVVVAFLICLSPIVIFVWLVQSLSDFMVGCTLADTYALIILSVNCAVNPILYGWRHPLFRKIFVCIFNRRFNEIELPSVWLRWLLRD